MKLDTSKKPTRNSKGNRFTHWCMAEGCQKWGCFGAEVQLRFMKPGIWLCREHHQEWKEMKNAKRRAS